MRVGRRDHIVIPADVRLVERRHAGASSAPRPLPQAIYLSFSRRSRQDAGDRQGPGTRNSFHVRSPFYSRSAAANPRLAFRRSMCRVPVVRAAHRRIELREDAIGVVAIDPHVSIEVRREHVRFVELGLRVVDHRIPCDAVERRRCRPTCGAPGGVMPRASMSFFSAALSFCSRAISSSSALRSSGTG